MCRIVIVVLIYHRHRPIASMKIDVGEMRWGSINWIILVQDRDK
jgi:hypothetical protein